jgi:hypothetical protein
MIGSAAKISAPSVLVGPASLSRVSFIFKVIGSRCRLAHNCEHWIFPHWLLISRLFRRFSRMRGVSGVRGIDQFNLCGVYLISVSLSFVVIRILFRLSFRYGCVHSRRRLFGPRQGFLGQPQEYELCLRLLLGRCALYVECDTNAHRISVRSRLWLDRLFPGHGRFPQNFWLPSSCFPHRLEHRYYRSTAHHQFDGHWRNPRFNFPGWIVHEVRS